MNKSVEIQSICVSFFSSLIHYDHHKIGLPLVKKKINKIGVNNREWIGEKGNFDIDKKKRTDDCQKVDMIMMTGYDLNLLISDMRMNVMKKKGQIDVMER